MMDIHGCDRNCVRRVHELSEYDVLSAHSSFAAKTLTQQRRWIFDYLANHCPNGECGIKEPKKLTFFLCGKSVCFVYQLKSFLRNPKRVYEWSSGTYCRTITCRQGSENNSLDGVIFSRIGDRRPDKDGIYLPTCFTFFDSMTGEQAVCFSQFNRIFRVNFPNVTIPMVLYQFILFT